MTASADAVREYLERLKFETSSSDGVLHASRRLGVETTRQFLRVFEAPVEARRALHSAAAALQAARGRSKSGVLRIVVLRATWDEVTELRALFSVHRIRVDNYNSFLDSMLGAEAICEQITSGMDFIRVHQTYIKQSVADESGSKLEMDSVEAVRTWMRKAHPGLLVILADAGYGKTSLAREIAYEMARARLQRPDAPVPIFVPFAQHRRVTEWAGLILVRLQEHGALGFHSDAFDFLVQEGRVLLILDGFDEMSEESGTKIAEENLRMIASHTAGRGRVVLTSRSTFFRSSAEVADIIEQKLDQSRIRTYELLAFNAEQRRDYLGKVTGDRASADRILSVVRGNEGLADLAGSPLVLWMLATAVEENPKRFTAGRERASLYELYFKALFERERTRQGHSLSDEEQFGFLERIADSMFADKTAAYGRPDIAYFVAESLPQRIERLRGRPVEEEALTSKLCDHAAFTSDGSAIAFQHPTFRDYFAARLWARRLREGTVASLARPNLSAASIDFVAELLPKETVRKLAAQNLSRSSDGQLLRNVLRLVEAYCRQYYPTDISSRRDLFASLVGSLPLALNSRDLSGLTFDGASFRGALLLRANLDGTKFLSCDLEGGDFTDAFLRMTYFDRCKLAGARFGDLSQFMSVRVGRSDLTIDHAGAAADRLIREGAVVSGRANPNPVAREVIVELLVDQFRRFRPEGRGNWELRRLEESLVRGLEGKRRIFVERELIPALVAGDYYRRRKVGSRSFVVLPSTKEAAALIESGTLSNGLMSLVDTLEATAERLMEL